MAWPACCSRFLRGGRGWRSLTAMLRRSLTAKVLLAVAVTVAVVIAIYTFFVIRVQSTWWHERTQAQNAIAVTMVREYLEGVMLSERHEEVTHFLNELKKSQEIYAGRVITRTGRIAFSTESQEVGAVIQQVPPDLFAENRMLQGTRDTRTTQVAVTMSPVQNHAACQRCHGPVEAFIGAIILEKSMAPAEASIATNRNLLIVYGAVIFALVGVVLWLLIVRFVSQPVGELLTQMRRVETGDLAARAISERVDEIGELERGFNGMVASLDTAKRQLHDAHEKQIQQAGKLASVGELAAGLAHEIRNPLAGIAAAVEVLAENRAGQDREITQEIQLQVKRLNTTLSDLLNFARPREPEIAPCDLAGLVRQMLTLVRADAQKHHIQVVEEIPADLPAINADATQIQQAILNLLLNAIQAMPEAGILTVRAAVVGDRVQLMIQDTGSGIPAEILEKIFAPFFTTKHRGTGLGLAITRTIMEKHGGTIRVDSAVGCGTMFTLEFGLAEVPHHGPT